MEKEKELKRRFSNLKISAFYSFHNPPKGDILLCTIEKANSIINKMIQEGNLADTISCIVVDEIHMMGHEERGYLLELLLTKVLLVAPGIQMVGMSATLSNVHVLASWLDAALFTTTFRPLQQLEFIKVATNIYDRAGTLVKTLNIPEKEAQKLGDPDLLVPVVFECISQGNSCLVFCATKRECESSCKMLSRLTAPDASLSPSLRRAREELVLDISQANTEMDEQVTGCLMNGFAFHHSDLLMEERHLLEEAFRKGVIHCLSCTSTLSSGVNLPARRVIFRSPFIAGKFLKSSEYQQMKGRAGRKGLDSFGESITFCKQVDFQRVKELVLSRPPPLVSCLASNEAGMIRALLEVTAGGLVKSLGVGKLKPKVCLFPIFLQMFQQAVVLRNYH